jgi:hypothetical protein
MSEIKIDREVVEAALDGLGVPWKRRDLDWLIPVGPRWPNQVALTVHEDRLRVEAVLVSWDELEPRERSALELLLARAEGGPSGVRFGLAEREAVAWTELPAGTSEAAVTEAVARVATAARLLAREAGALLGPEVAEGYLRFFGAGSESATGPARI